MYNRRFVIYLAVSLFVFLLIGCGGSTGPVSPDFNTQNLTANSVRDSGQRHYWGLWDCFIDPLAGTTDIVPMRGPTFTANVNNILEGQPGNLLIQDMDLSGFFTEGRLDCTITLRHPLPGLDMYHGFDVWGVFMHNGSVSLDYDGLSYADGTTATDAIMLNPDGYTRWFNYTEFDGNGIPIVEYWPGKLSDLMNPSATLNPYKIFADGLDTGDDYYGWITDPSNAENRGIYRAGQANSRRYELQFPFDGSAPVLHFQYAVVASWEPGDPSLTGTPALYDPFDFPTSANCEEPFFLNIETGGSDLYFVDSETYGGTLRADIEVFDWQGGIAGGFGVPNEVNRIILEGDFIPGGNHEFSEAELSLVAAPASENSSVFQVEITDCTPGAVGDDNFWVVVEAGGLNGESYSQGFPTEFPEDTARAAFLPGIVTVSDNPPFVPVTYNLTLDIERDSNDMIVGIILDWDDNDLITGYNIYRQDPFDDSDDWTLIPDCPVVDSTFTDYDIVGNEAYQYRVVALLGASEMPDVSVEAYAILENAEDNVNTDSVWETCAFPIMYNPSWLPGSLFNEFAPHPETPNNGTYCWDESGLQNGYGTVGWYWTGSATLFATPVLPLPDGADTCEVDFYIRLLNQWPDWTGMHAGAAVGVTDTVVDAESNPFIPSDDFIDGLDYNLDLVHGFVMYELGESSKNNFTNIDLDNCSGHGTQYPGYENPVWTWSRFAVPDVFTLADARVAFAWGAANAATGTNQGNPGTSYDDIAVLIY